MDCRWIFFPVAAEEAFNCDICLDLSVSSSFLEGSYLLEEVSALFCFEKYKKLSSLK